MNKSLTVSLLLALTIGACTNPPARDPLTDAPPVLENYATVLLAEYDDSIAGANALRTASMPLFSGTATQESLDGARMAWRTARVPYQQSEYGRFYNGPIDDPDMDNQEALLNSWPLDENTIDYVVGAPMSGIINDTSDFPQISEMVIHDDNANPGEKNITTGYHAVEFLLWGQDMNPDGPGNRPFSDYVVGTGMNADRRRTYLDVATQLIIDNLTQVRGQWAEGTGAYRTAFVSGDPHVGIGRIILGMGKLTEGELAGQRIHTPYTTKDQEDEHSCFSDNTVADYTHDVQGLLNAYFGTYTRADGTVVGDPTHSLSALVHTRDPDLDTRMRAQLQTALTDIHAWPLVANCPSTVLQGMCPFDQLILGVDTDPGRMAIQLVINDLHTIATTLAEVATALGLDLQAANFEADM